MSNTLQELSSCELSQVSGGWDSEIFLHGLGYAAIGAVAVAAAPFVATSIGIGLALSGGIAGVGGGALMAIATSMDDNQSDD